jgi:hypothetical protein
MTPFEREIEKERQNAALQLTLTWSLAIPYPVIGLILDP